MADKTYEEGTNIFKAEQYVQLLTADNHGLVNKIYLRERVNVIQKTR